MKLFRKAALHYGKNFAAIARIVKTKSRVACQRRGHNVKKKLEKKNTDPELYDILKVSLN